MSVIPENLIILEMANNHMGSVDHGINIIDTFSVLIDKYPKFKFAMKLQYRDLQTFIRPDYVGRMDVKHVKRFADTSLSRSEQRLLVKKMRDCGFITMCTPFDERSVDHIKQDEFDILKIASCSLGDWTLMEKIVKTEMPIVASTGGAKLETIDAVVDFLSNRGKDFILQHCIGEYPTPSERTELNQIDFLKKRHPLVRFGFSTHEDPSDTDLIKMAIAKGAVSFERHIGLSTKIWGLNQYSSDFEQISNWLEAGAKALSICGLMDDIRYKPSSDEFGALKSLQRGAFAKRKISRGEIIKNEDIELAFPPNNDQLTGNLLSKYSLISALEGFEPGEPISLHQIKLKDQRDAVLEKAERVVELLKKSKVTFPSEFELELSHHYGLSKFYQYGLSMITLINRDYCKKILICLPSQKHPEQFHKLKEETFHVLDGTVQLDLNGSILDLKPGSVTTINTGTKHSFVSSTGAIIEEISSRHYEGDSYYTDPEILNNVNRKTQIKWRIN
jgi:sialic acid synthase SpsE/mannose-6-phosphate isomerase-like protein (cupin superfamily)